MKAAVQITTTNDPHLEYNLRLSVAMNNEWTKLLCTVPDKSIETLAKFYETTDCLFSWLISVNVEIIYNGKLPFVMMHSLKHTTMHLNEKLSDMSKI